VRLGVVSSALTGLEFEAGLDLCCLLGLDAIEVACAGFQEDLRYGDPERLSDDHDARERWREAIASRGLEISALALHGQPLSPDPSISSSYDRQFRAACRLAEQVGVTRLTLLAGVPEGAPGDRAPCWIASAFPPVNHDILAWQWEERVIPYWREHAAVAAGHGCRLCFEMHPNDVVYNPRSLLRLRDAAGPSVGANFDPSHLFWQGIDPVAALRELSGCLFHVHAKDTATHTANARVNGVLDSTPFACVGERSWSFRTVGFGHGDLFWRGFVSALSELGYDDVVSIEQEDEYIGPEEGLRKAVAALRPVIW
jgi:sugar phosphate isomerase/epimerase